MLIASHARPTGYTRPYIRRRLEQSSHTTSLHESDENDPLALHWAIERVLPPHMPPQADAATHSSMMELLAYNERMQRVLNTARS